LYFGVNEAFDRLNAQFYTEAQQNITRTLSDGNDTSISFPDSLLDGVTVYNPCLPGQSTYQFTSRVRMLPNHTLLPLSSPDDARVLEAEPYSALMGNPNEHGDVEMCSRTVRDLLRKDANTWCDFAHDRDCSFAGIYQPPLPMDSKDFGDFIATSNFYDVWDFLQLPSQATMQEAQDATARLCSMSLTELQAYNQARIKPLTDEDELVQFCFRAAFVTEFIVHGVGFPLNYTMTAIDVIDGQKLGWALGSMLYEINTLPWRFEHHAGKNVLQKLVGNVLPISDGTWMDMQDGMGESFMLVLTLSLVMGLLYLGLWRPLSSWARQSSSASRRRHGSKPVAEGYGSLSGSTKEQEPLIQDTTGMQS
jgi:hypothetical protein